jgi:hypothetical protein
MVSKQPVSRIDGIAFFIIVLGILTILTPWFATQSGMDVSIFVTPMFLIIGILNIVAGLALFFVKSKT